VGVEGDLDADEGGDHRDRGAAEHRAGGRARVLADRDGRPDQDGQHEQCAEPLNRDGHGGREQGEQREADGARANTRRSRARGVERVRRERPVEGGKRGTAEAHQQGGREEVTARHAEWIPNSSSSSR
jgi:hypothetical protein